TEKAPRVVVLESQINGEIYRSKMQAIAPRGHRPVSQGAWPLAGRQMQDRHPAGRPWRRPPAALVRLCAAVAREAEAAAHVWCARAPVPQLLQESCAAERLNRCHAAAIA